MTESQSLGIDEYRALLDEVFDRQIAEWTAEAEASERFPRKLIEHLGQSGVFAHKWGDGQHPDVAKLVALAFALGRLGSAGIGRGQLARLRDRDPAPVRPVGLSEGRLRAGDPRRGSVVHRRLRGVRRFGLADRRDRSTFGARRIRGPRSQEVRIAVAHRRSDHGGGARCGSGREQPAWQRTGDRGSHVADRGPGAVPQSRRGPAGHRGGAYRHLGAGGCPHRPSRHRSGRDLVGSRWADGGAT